MKKLCSLAALLLLFTVTVLAQKDNSKRASPAATTKATIASGATITISYSRPSVKGRTIGKDLEPMEGQVWRAGANEATVFETSKAVSIEGKALPAGKYAFFTIKNGKNWTLIFNRNWKVWGAYDYAKNKAQDALQVTVREPEVQTMQFFEQLTYTIGKDGHIVMGWGPHQVGFSVK